MKLLIIPGGGDPESTDYKLGFDLLRDEAAVRGFEDVFIFKFPGHSSWNGEKSFHNQKVSSEILAAELLKMEKLNLSYMLYARSYGCGIVMKVILENSLPNLKRVVLWGPSPIVAIYKATVLDKALIENAKKHKGCFLSEETYLSCDPFEIQLLNYNGNHIINVGAGTEDTFCKPVFFSFLNDYIKLNNVTFTTISGLAHEVTVRDKRYLDFVFGSLFNK